MSVGMHQCKTIGTNNCRVALLQVASGYAKDCHHLAFDEYLELAPYCSRLSRVRKHYRTADAVGEQTQRKGRV